MKWLTKSDYLKYLIHPAYLWLQKYDKDRLPPFDETGEALVRQGNEVEAVARQLFPGGIAVESLFKQAALDTKRLMATGHDIIYQATVLTDRGLFAMADILVRVEGGWAMYEVKSSTKAKEPYIADLAFQRLAFEEAGQPITSSFLVHINSHYVRHGELDPAEFLVVTDQTEAVATILSRTRRNVQAALKVVAATVCPDDDPRGAGNYYEWMQIYRHLHLDLADDSILNLCRLTPGQVRDLLDRGITTINQVPADIGLKPQQITQIAAVKAGRALINRTKIARSLAKLTYPLWFLDYETTFPAIPTHDGGRPYEQIPFQYSLHVLDKPGGKLRQHEFLATDNHNPMPDLLEHLKTDLGPEGSVIVWNKVFEMGVNDQLGAHYPDYAEWLRSVNRRVYDLMDVFAKGYYADAGFFGSASIKRVLPVLVPELSYKTLAIQEGQAASLRWADAASGRLDAAEAEQVFADLLVYCGQDTLAMVRIYEVLRDLVAELPQQIDLLGTIEIEE